MQVVLVGFLEKVIYGLELEGETLPVWHLKETCLKDKTPEIKGWSLPNVFKMYVYSAIREQEAEENFTGLGVRKRLHIMWKLSIHSRDFSFNSE